MDAKVKDAFKQVRQFAKYLEAMVLVCDQADALAVSEQTVSEQEQIVAKLKAEAAQLAQANSEARGIAAETIAAAKANADSITANASRSADAVMAEALAAAARTQEEGAQAVQRLSERYQILEGAALELIAQCDARKKELVELEDKMGKARTKIAKLLEG